MFPKSNYNFFEFIGRNITFHFINNIQRNCKLFLKWIFMV